MDHSVLKINLQRSINLRVEEGEGLTARSIVDTSHGELGQASPLVLCNQEITEITTVWFSSQSQSGGEWWGDYTVCDDTETGGGQLVITIMIII